MFTLYFPQNVHYLIGRKQWVKWNVVICSVWLSDDVISFPSIKLCWYQISPLTCVSVCICTHSIYVWIVSAPCPCLHLCIYLCMTAQCVCSHFIMARREQCVWLCVKSSESRIAVNAAVPPLGFEAMKTTAAVTAYKPSRELFSPLEGLEMLSL